MPNKLLLCLFAVVLTFITACDNSDVTSEADSSSTSESPQAHSKNGASSMSATPSSRAAANKNIKPAPLVKLPIPSATEMLASKITVNDIVNRANALVPLLKKLRATIDRSQFDLISLNGELEFDGAAIVDFVRDSISFEQYVGVLRGAQGTLLGRAGNALDQSLLLTTLLDDAGFESRVAYGTLSIEQAKELMDQVSKKDSPLPAAKNEAALQTTLNEIMELEGFSAKQLAQLNQNSSDDFYTTNTESDTHFILDAIDQAGLQIGDPDALVKLVEEARSYYWVEYRLNAFDSWQAAHPAFASTPSIVAEGTFIRPPAELYHRVRFETFVEQKIGDELIVSPIVSDWQKTTEELVGTPFTYTNQPNNINYESMVDIPGLLRKSGIFYPIINGAMAGNGFDLEGMTYKLELLAMDKMGATQLSGTKSRQLGQASELIGSLGKATENKTAIESVKSLTGHWVEYTVITPNAEDKTYRRYVLDRIGVENRLKGNATIVDQTDLGQLAQSLLANYTIMVIPNRYSKAYTLERYVQRAMQEIAFINQVADSATPETLSTLNMAQLKPAQDVVLTAAFDGGVTSSADVKTYRAEATLVVYEEGVIPSATADTFFERVDVVHNERRTFSVGEKLDVNQLAAVRVGVWETHSERAPLRKTGIEYNTAVGFREASTQNRSLRVLSPQDIESVDTLYHSALTKHNLKEVLGQGYAVIIPSEPLQAQSDTVWWRVDLQSGNTLGMSTGGYGVTFTEYLIKTTSVSVALTNVANCMGSTGNYSCCLLVGGAMFVIGKFITYFSHAAFALGVSIAAGPGGVGVGGHMCSE